MVVSKKYKFFEGLELSTVTTSGIESKVVDLGGENKAFGKEIVGADMPLELGGLKMLMTGSHGIAGTGTITFEVYTGKSGTGAATTKIDTLGPFNADSLGTVRQLNFQDYLVQGTVKVKAVASAASAFTAGKLELGLTTTL